MTLFKQAQNLTRRRLYPQQDDILAKFFKMKPYASAPSPFPSTSDSKPSSVATEFTTSPYSQQQQQYQQQQSLVQNFSTPINTPPLPSISNHMDAATTAAVHGLPNFRFASFPPSTVNTNTTTNQSSSSMQQLVTPAPSISPFPQNMAAQKRPRKVAKLACVSCRKAHACCEDQRPCARCLAHGLECQDMKGRKRGRKKKSEKDDDDQNLDNDEQQVQEPEKKKRKKKKENEDLKPIMQQPTSVMMNNNTMALQQQQQQAFAKAAGFSNELTTILFHNPDTWIINNTSMLSGSNPMQAQYQEQQQLLNQQQAMLMSLYQHAPANTSAYMSQQQQHMLQQLQHPSMAASNSTMPMLPMNTATTTTTNTSIPSSNNNTTHPSSVIDTRNIDPTVLSITLGGPSSYSPLDSNLAINPDSLLTQMFDESIFNTPTNSSMMMMSMMDQDGKVTTPSDLLISTPPMGTPPAAMNSSAPTTPQQQPNTPPITIPESNATTPTFVAPVSPQIVDAAAADHDHVSDEVKHVMQDCVSLIKSLDNNEGKSQANHAANSNTTATTTTATTPAANATEDKLAYMEYLSTVQPITLEKQQQQQQAAAATLVPPTTMPNTSSNNTPMSNPTTTTTHTTTPPFSNLSAIQSALPDTDDVLALKKQVASLKYECARKTHELRLLIIMNEQLRTRLMDKMYDQQQPGNHHHPNNGTHTSQQQQAFNAAATSTTSALNNNTSIIAHNHTTSQQPAMPTTIATTTTSTTLASPTTTNAVAMPPPKTRNPPSSALKSFQELDSLIKNRKEMDSSNFGIMICFPGGRIVSMNQKLLDVLGYSSSDVFNKLERWEDVIAPAHYANVISGITKCLKAAPAPRKSFCCDVACRTKNGTCVFVK